MIFSEQKCRVNTSNRKKKGIAIIKVARGMRQNSVQDESVALIKINVAL
jgi:hypothetical protein